MRIHLIHPFLLVTSVLLLVGCPDGGSSGGVLDAGAVCGDQVCATNESCDCSECAAEERCTVEPPDPVTTANVVGYVEVRIDRQGTGTPSSLGAIQVVEAATPAVERDKLRSQALAGLRSSAVGECISAPRLDSPNAQRIVYATGPVMPRTGGGTPLTFSTMGFLQSAVEAGASYDLLVAPQTGFGGVNGPGLIKVPPPVSSLVAGSPTPGSWDLGRFPPGSALPTMTWGDAPSGPASDILVRVFDPRNGATGGPTLAFCRVAPTATNWTMPQAIYDALDTTDPAMSFDRIDISLTFANLELASVTGSTADEKILVTSLWKESQITMTKPAN